MKKYGFILEVIVALLALEAINRAWVHVPPGLIGVQPHPYWLIVILIATRYGLAAGFWGSALCGAALIAGTFLAQTDSLAVFLSPQNFLANFAQPLVFILVGMVVGEIRSRQDHRLCNAREQADKAAEHAKDLEENLDAVQESKEELQKRIVGQVETVSTLYDAAKSLESLDEEELYPAVLDLLTRYLGSRACSVYLLEGRSLVRKVHRAVNGEAVPPAECGLEGSVMGQAIRQRATIAVPELLTQGDFDGFKGDALMASPIFDLAQNPVGAIGISSMGFYDFSPSNRKLFDMIADWSNAAIQNAMYFRQTADKNIRDDELGVFNYNYFEQRIEEEFADAQRHKFPLSLMVIRFDTRQDFPRDRYVLFIKSLSEALHASLRKVDLVTKYRYDHSLAVTVRTKKAQDVTVLAERLQAEITELASKVQRREGDIEVTIGVATVEAKMESPAELMEHAETAAGLTEQEEGE